MITPPQLRRWGVIIRTEYRRRSPSKDHYLLVGFVVLVAAVADLFPIRLEVVGLIAGVVVKNHQISMALMVFYSLGNSLLSSR